MANNLLQDATEGVGALEAYRVERSTSESIGFGVTTSVVSALTQLSDIPTSVGNMFRNESNKKELTDIEGVVQKYLGSNAAAYYQDNQEIVDVVGFVASSFAPGVGGIKLAQGAQTAARAAMAGKDVHPFYKHALNLSAPNYAQALKDLKINAALQTNSSILRSEGLTAIRRGVGQAAIESLAFEIGVVATMGGGHVLGELDASELAWNMALGVGLGTTFSAPFVMAKAYGINQAGLADTTKIVNAYGIPKMPDTALPTSLKVLHHLREIKFEPSAVSWDKISELAGDVAAQAKFENMISAKRTQVQEKHRNEALGNLNQLTGGDSDTSLILLDKLLKADIDEQVNTLYAMQKFVPAGTSTPLKRATKEELISFTAPNQKIEYFDIIENKSFGTNAPKYTAIADLPNSKVSIQRDSVVVDGSRIKIETNLGIDFKPELHSIRELDARNTWMGSQKNSYFTKADSIRETDFGAIDAIIYRLESGTLKPTEFAGGKLKLRTSDGKVQQWDLTTELPALKQQYLVTKLNKASELMQHPSKGIVAGTEEEVAQVLRRITGIPLEVRDLSKSGARGQYDTFSGKDYGMSQAGTITIDSNAIGKTSIGSMLRTIMHEYGHLRDIAVRGDIATLSLKAISPKAVKEAIKLSKMARPQHWKNQKQVIDKKTGQTMGDYLKSHAELMADARMMLSLIDESQLGKYPELRNMFGTSLVRADSELARLTGISADAMTGNADAVARAVNLNPEAVRNPLSAQLEDVLYREARFAKLMNLREKSEATPYNTPYVHKAVYDYDAVKTDINEVRGAALIEGEVKAVREFNSAIADSVLGDTFAAHLPANDAELLDIAMRTADIRGTGAGAITSSNADLGTLGSYSKWIGGVLNRALNDKVREVENTFESFTTKIQSDREFAVGFSSLNNTLRGTPHKYIIDEDTGNLILKDAKQYQEALAKAADDGLDASTVSKPSSLDDPKAEQILELSRFVSEDKVEDLRQMLILHRDVNAKEFANRAKMEYGLYGKSSLNTVDEDVIYPIATSTNKKPYMAYVFDSKAVNGTSHHSIIYADSESALKELQQKVMQQEGGHVIFRSQEEVSGYYKQLKEFDGSRVFNSRHFESELLRRGLDASYFVPTNPDNIAQDFLNFHANAAKGNLRNAVKLKYNNVIKTLETAAELSETTFVGGKQAKATNPYNTYIQEMLDISNYEAFGWWKQAGDAVENFMGSLHKAVYGGIKGKVSEQELSEINAQLEKAGIKNAFADPMTMQLANQGVEYHTATKFVSALNGTLGFFLLRSDPLHGINNLIGHNILYQAELRSVIDQIKAKDPKSGVLAKLELDLPGNGDAKTLNPTKITMQAMTDFWERPDLRELYTTLGLNLDISAQVKQLMGEVAPRLNDTTETIAKKTNDWLEKSGKFLEKWTGNKFSEEMTNFVSARTMHIIMEEAVAKGVIPQKAMWPYINTFTNRVRGTYVASQRPGMFQGPIGMSMALFQTYATNLMQQFFRHVSDGNKRTAMMMLGLQGSIYGANGMPGYNMVNQGVLTTMAGNESGQDITSGVYNLAGMKGGDWIIYGGASNFLTLLGNENLGTNIHTRGDVNPRHLTVLPINPIDAPWVQGWSKFFGNIYDTGAKLASGASVYETIARGIEHNGISRPLSGIGKTLQGLGNENFQVYSTDRSGKLLATYDLFSLNTAIGLIGGKSLSEARAIDGLHRLKAYNSDKSGDMARLKEVIRSHSYGKDLTGGEFEEMYSDWMAKYVANGGDIIRFRAFMMDAMKEANNSYINAAASVNGSKYGQSLQTLMGGEFAGLEY